MLKKKLPVGIDNFEKLRKEDFYYVDKTGLIVDLMNSWGEVNLFTRPRRFGKTLNMKMLKAFFEIGGDKSIFDGLAVSNDKALCDMYMSKYPVLFVSLKGVDGLDFETAYKALCQIIVDEAARLRFLVDSDKIADDEKGFLARLINERYDASDIRKSLQMLCRLLEKNYAQKAILLIDEYDVPLDKAFHHGYYAQMIDVIRAMFGAALKTNDSLFMAVMTGCLRVSKESIFTGLNNLRVHSISDEKFDEFFGFTDAEVRKMLKDYDIEHRYNEAHDWYDGYRFGRQDIYCPWDVINFCYDAISSEHAQPKAYWINTSGNDMVRRLISKGTDGTTQFEIERLIAGETITKTLNENLTHNEIDANIENIWSLLYMTGYLTSVGYPNGRQYELRIPNKEVRQIYMEQVLDWFKDKTRAESEKLIGLYEAFEAGNADTIKDYLDEQLLDTVSFYDAHESFYHGFLLALLSTCANWRVSSNIETGKGRSDVVVERKDRKIGFVVEVKDVKEYEKLDAACDNAMKQIEERDYTAILRRYRVKTIWTYGIAFWDKECKVVVKRVV